MRILYLDLGMGAAGDMLSAALFELLDEKQKTQYLEKMNHLGLEGVSVKPERAEKCGIAGTHMTVLVNGHEELDAVSHENGHFLHGCDAEAHHEHPAHHDDMGGHDADDACAEEHPEHPAHHDDAEGHHAHHHHHSSPAHINEAIRGMDLPASVKEDALAVYAMLADAESAAHGTDVQQIHFHEVGEKDAVADIVSVCLLMAMLAPDRTCASSVAVGSGTVRCAHGILPVPAPATAYLLKNAKIPCFAGPVESELLTPTGAALIGHFADTFGPMPEMTITGIGYGMGRKDFPQANCVRAVLGEAADGDFGPSGGGQPAGRRDEVYELSCNLDDMTPEDIAFAADRLFSAGALDVFTTAVGMKKNRPGVLLTALCHREQRETVAETFFRYTTTLGVREKTCGRWIMTSGFSGIGWEKKDGHIRFLRSNDKGNPSGNGEAGTLRIKVSEGYGVRREKPEFDQLASLAEELGISTAQLRGMIRNCPDNAQNS